jgi:hypothetical protein
MRYPTPVQALTKRGRPRDGTTGMTMTVEATQRRRWDGVDRPLAAHCAGSLISAIVCSLAGAYAGLVLLPLGSQSGLLALFTLPIGIISGSTIAIGQVLVTTGFYLVLIKKPAGVIAMQSIALVAAVSSTLFVVRWEMRTYVSESCEYEWAACLFGGHGCGDRHKSGARNGEGDGRGHRRRYGYSKGPGLGHGDGRGGGVDVRGNQSKGDRDAGPREESAPDAGIPNEPTPAATDTTPQPESSSQAK